MVETTRVVQEKHVTKKSSTETILHNGKCLGLINISLSFLSHYPFLRYFLFSLAAAGKHGGGGRARGGGRAN
jgi:hypothetical protein